MTEVFVGMGSNIEPAVYVPQGLAALEDAFGALEVSSAYRCPAVGFTGGDFVNLVVAFETDADVHAAQAALREIEAICGRNRQTKSRSRTMDLDMLLYGDLVYDDGDIRVPRADILAYAFVLGPLAELRPGYRHPVSRRLYAEMWAEFDDKNQPLTRVDL